HHDEFPYLRAVQKPRLQGYFIVHQPPFYGWLMGLGCRFGRIIPWYAAELSWGANLHATWGGCYSVINCDVKLRISVRPPG
ncbi:hypothetical protein ABTG30_19080, partial [Acinetobacter baumannii]